MQGITVTLDELLALRYIANQLNLPNQKITSSAQQGNYQSTFRGRGMDFVETRIYQPGDDTRTINWAVTARTGKPHTKIYQQERERPIYIIIDFSPTMFFGTRNAFKSVMATKAATLIAWSALKNNDRVGALLMKGDFQILPPGQRKQNLLEILKKMVQFVQPENHQPCDYISAFARLKKIVKSGSLIYFLSDFYFFDEALQKELQQLAMNNEVFNILVYDQLEKNPPQKGQYLFHAPIETKSLLLDTHNTTFCAEYSAIFNNRRSNLKKLCFATGMHLTELCTSDNLVKVIRHILMRKM